MKISGFTIVRNARKLEYPFEESVRSVLPLCDEFVINVGDSTDDTLEIAHALARESSKVRVITSVWQRENQTGGYQLKAQTDRALDECKGDWCVYIQADEAMHESDFGKIRETMQLADTLPEVDGILFNYLHFYGNFSYVITGRNWYRREVRAIKNGRGIRSFRDAQGFRRIGEKKVRVIPSGARVFHYGYVRSAVSLGKKSEEMAQWWGKKPETNLARLQPRRHVGLKVFRDSHPSPMRERIARNDTYFDPTRCKRVWDRNEIKNAITLLWESIIPVRLGEFKNYEIVDV